MKPARLEQLSDGIFAIVMTVLVFELKWPELTTIKSNRELMHMLVDMSPIFLSYLLAFVMLFNYWRAHHFFMSVYAKNIDTTLTNINAFFFLLVGLVPFSAALLGQQGNLELPVIIFSVNVILLGLCLYMMRDYVFRSPTIKNPEVTHAEITRGTIRTFIPILFAMIAIPLSFYSHDWALVILTLAIVFNFSRTSTHFFNKFIK